LALTNGAEVFEADYDVLKTESTTPLLHQAKSTTHYLTILW